MNKQDLDRASELAASFDDFKDSEKEALILVTVETATEISSILRKLVSAVLLQAV